MASPASSPRLRDVTLDDKYELDSGRVYPDRRRRRSSAC